MDQAPPINQAARRLTLFLLLAVSSTLAANSGPAPESSLQGILVSAGPLTPERVDSALPRLATHPRQDGSVIAFLPPTQAERADQKQIASRTASALTNVQSTLTLPPSILSGRADHYQVGERWFDLALGCFRFIDNEYEYFPTNLEASLTQYSTFGGHEAIPHDVKPVGRIEWGSHSAGHFTPPGSGPTETNPSLSFTATPSEIESGTVLRVTLPESAQDARFQLYSNCPDLDLAPLEWDVLIRIEIPVTPLQRLEAMESANGKARFNIQRATNSHGNDAGYASAQATQSLQSLANRYGRCPVNAALPCLRANRVH